MFIMAHYVVVSTVFSWFCIVVLIKLAVIVSSCVLLHRNLMGSVEVKVSSGQLEVSKEKNLLVWVLGMSILNLP